MWDIVWVSPQGHGSVSVSRHLFLQAPQCPSSVRKRFSRDHCCRGRSKPGNRIVGSHTRWELTTWADFQLCLHRFLMSTGCKSSHSGFLDVSRSNGGLSISGWIGQLSCLTIFSTSLSVAAFLRRAGGSMLESTGSHGRGVERRVPEMRRMVELAWTMNVINRLQRSHSVNNICSVTTVALCWEHRTDNGWQLGRYGRPAVSSLTSFVHLHSITACMYCVCMLL